MLRMVTEKGVSDRASGRGFACALFPSRHIDTRCDSCGRYGGKQGEPLKVEQMMNRSKSPSQLSSAQMTSRAVMRETADKDHPQASGFYLQLGQGFPSVQR